MALRLPWIQSQSCCAVNPRALKACPPPGHKDSSTFRKSSPHTSRIFTAALASFINTSGHPFPLLQTATVTCIRISAFPWKACLDTPSKMTKRYVAYWLWRAFLESTHMDVQAYPTPPYLPIPHNESFQPLV